LNSLPLKLHCPSQRTQQYFLLLFHKESLACEISGEKPPVSKVFVTTLFLARSSDSHNLHFCNMIASCAVFYGFLRVRAQDESDLCLSLRPHAVSYDEDEQPCYLSLLHSQRYLRAKDYHDEHRKRGRAKSFRPLAQATKSSSPTSNG
jgi:hypothetical protein